MSSASELLVTKKDWIHWSSQTFNYLPVMLKLPLESGFKIKSWENAWEAGSRHAFVLESGKGGRYTYLGLRPSSIIYGKGKNSTIIDQSGSRSHMQPPIQAVKAWMSRVKAPKVNGAPVFTGGAVGFWGYDVVRSLEKIPNIAKDDVDIPDYCFYQIDELWIVDHEQSVLYCALHVLVTSKDETDISQKYDTAYARLQEMATMWSQFSSVNNKAIERERTFSNIATEDHLKIDIDSINGIKRSFDKETFVQAVQKIQEYIRQGDVFQVNLSTRQSLTLTSDPEDIYEWLRLLNPSPYMGLFKSEHFQLVSASPELLVKLHDGKVSTRPIAGTRKRGNDPNEDEKMASELLSNEKERAEHIMLVDLLRNDIGRIAAYGSVKVEDFMVIERYSHVMHLVSEVTGTLADGKDGYDMISAVFPGGTITGAPKIRTMEIIEELEPVRRGPYTGSIGFIDYRGNMEFNIIIRTLTVSGKIGHIQAGAGIVIDSDPDREYKESLNKAKALWKAIEYSEQIVKEGKR